MVCSGERVFSDMVDEEDGMERRVVMSRLELVLVVVRSIVRTG